MIDWVARARHRFHSRLTKKLAKAQNAVVRAETGPSTGYLSLDKARIGKAKAQLERAMNEIKLWEAEHPDE